MITCMCIARDLENGLSKGTSVRTRKMVMEGRANRSFVILGFG